MAAATTFGAAPLSPAPRLLVQRSRIVRCGEPWVVRCRVIPGTADGCFQVSARFCDKKIECRVYPDHGCETESMRFAASAAGHHVLSIEVKAQGVVSAEGCPDRWVAEVGIPVEQGRSSGAGPAVIHIDGSGNDIHFDPSSGAVEVKVSGSGNAVGPARGQPGAQVDLGFSEWLEVPLKARRGTGVLRPQLMPGPDAPVPDRLTIRSGHGSRSECSLLLLGDQLEVGRSLRSLDLRALLPAHFSPEKRSAELAAVSALALRLDARELSTHGLAVIVDNRNGATIDDDAVGHGGQRQFREIRGAIDIVIDSRGPIGTIALRLKPMASCLDIDGLDRSSLGHVGRSVSEARRARVGGFLIEVRIHGQVHQCHWVIDSVSASAAGFGPASEGCVVLAAGQRWWIAVRKDAGRDWDAWPLVPGPLAPRSGFSCRLEAGLEPGFGGA